MPRRSEFPKIIRIGSVTVRVYRVKHKTTASGFAFVVVWNDGWRRFTQRASLEAAMEEGRIKASQLAAGNIEAAEMTRRDRDELVAARRLCGAMPLLAALEEWKTARELASGQLISAAEFWAARNGVGFEEISVSETAKRFLKRKEALGVDTSVSYRKIFPTLTEVFGDRSLKSISSRELAEWLGTRHPHPVTHNTARKRVVSLWRWARKEGYLPRDALTEAEQTESAREKERKIGVITAEVFEKLLKHIRECEPSYLAALVIAGFCGLRTIEVHHQSWNDVHLDRQILRVTRAKKNTPADRIVPLAPVAVEWLNLCPKREGEVCAGSPRNTVIYRIRAMGHAMEIELPHNCFRHSFISHRVAQTGDVAETSLESGNSPREIYESYREVVSKDEGQAWFEIHPSK